MSEPTDHCALNPPLSAVEARVLGCLMEKQRTTPNNYPLTLNALVQACNQKTSRVPVMQLEEGEVGHTVNVLRDRGLIRVGGLGRAERYHHRLGDTLDLNQPQQAVLCVLMLRSAQTLNEIRSNAERMASFADSAVVRATLEELMGRHPPLITLVPHGPGRREDRYAHLLGGPIDLDSLPVAAPAPRVAGADRLGELEDRLASLEREVERLWQLTGLADQRPAPGEEER